MRVSVHLLPAAVLALAGVSLAIAQAGPDASRFSPPLSAGNFVPLGASGTAAWYLDLSSQKVVVCTKGGNAAPSCETAPMPR